MTNFIFPTSGPFSHFVVSFSKFLSRVNRGGMEEGRFVLCSHVPSLLHQSLWPPCVQPDWYLLENLYKGTETWVSSKSWYPKEINLFPAGNKITGTCRETTHQKIGNNVPIHWLGSAFFNDAITRLVSKHLSLSTCFIISQIFSYKYFCWNVSLWLENAWTFHSNFIPKYL